MLPLEGGLQCGSISNIDLVAGNILIGNEKVSVIDYEWTFAFPIPAHFIMYRMIHYYLESDGKRRVLKERDFTERQGLLYRSRGFMAVWRLHSKRYMQGAHIPLLAMYEEVSPERQRFFRIMSSSGWLWQRRICRFSMIGRGLSGEGFLSVSYEQAGDFHGALIPKGGTAYPFGPG